jgi:hypothetical protein
MVVSPTYSDENVIHSLLKFPVPKESFILAALRLPLRFNSYRVPSTISRFSGLDRARSATPIISSMVKSFRVINTAQWHKWNCLWEVSATKPDGRQRAADMGRAMSHTFRERPVLVVGIYTLLSRCPWSGGYLSYKDEDSAMVEDINWTSLRCFVMLDLDLPWSVSRIKIYKAHPNAMSKYFKT